MDASIAYVLTVLAGLAPVMTGIYQCLDSSKARAVMLWTMLVIVFVGVLAALVQASVGLSAIGSWSPQ